MGGKERRREIGTKIEGEGKGGERMGRNGCCFSVLLLLVCGREKEKRREIGTNIEGKGKGENGKQVIQVSCVEECFTGVC